MAKGALAIGVGAALLLGGGGTLAVWNDTESSAAGSIAAGELSVATAKDGEGKWTNTAGKDIKLAEYKVVPGDVLTYTQKLDVKLVGDLMAAKLTMTQPTFTPGGFTAADVDVVLPTLTNAKGAVLPDTILTQDDSGVVTASAKFIFKDTGAGQKQNATNVAATFGAITFKLDQQAVPATKP